ncbi:hypothetical protein NQ315_000249 [Exocentrus adspersus]|uniref:Uncharacterized protein n=1 Tax=Exocentrus adspersus TaxID=1586481 RepID=A0AAV8VRI0_9CUCU|nr:hypothetical protein NQ315_000249 [Exocentrus adspersus]
MRKDSFLCSGKSCDGESNEKVKDEKQQRPEYPHSGMTLPTAAAAPVVDGMMLSMPDLPSLQSLVEVPSMMFWERVTACTVVIRASLMPNLSWITFASGAKQLVVQEAIETILQDKFVSLEMITKPWKREKWCSTDFPDWLLLLRHFNSLDACWNVGPYLKEVNDKDFIETATVQALVSISNSEFLNKFNAVHGFLSLETWHTDCPKNYAKPDGLEIYFDIPEVAKSNVTEFDVCVNIRGPEEYLPKFSQPNCVVSTNTNNKNKALAHLFTYGTCKTGAVAKLEFYPQNKENFANYLSQSEKDRIYIHLIWTSYFLLFLLLGIVVYGTLQTEHIFDKYLHKFVPQRQY